MKKFKLLVSSLIAMLAFAIFAVTGIRVNATIVTDGGSSNYLTYAVSSTSANWTLNSSVGTSLTSTSNDLYGLVPIESVSPKAGGYWEIKKYSSNKYYGCYLPVPSNAAGTLTLTPNSGNGSNRQVQLYNGSLIGDAMNITTSAVEFSFTSANLYTSDDINYFIGFTVPNTAGAVKLDSISISLTSGKFKEGTSSPITYTLNYAMNDGTDDLHTTQTYTDTTGNSTSHSFEFPTAPTRTGYDFLGWSTTTAGTILSGSSYSVSSSNSTTTIYAIWLKSVSTNTSIYFATEQSSEYFAISNATFDENSHLKLTSSTNIVFKLENDMKLTLSYAELAEEQIIYVDDVSKTIDSTNYSIDLEKGSHTISRGNFEVLISSIVLEAPVTVTAAAPVEGVSTEGNAVAFIAKIENVTDVTLLTNMTFHVSATCAEKNGSDDYAVSTCYTALTTFGDSSVSGCAAAENTYYVYFVVYGLTNTYDGLELNVTFNASYDGVALTQTTFDTYTYTA